MYSMKYLAIGALWFLTAETRELKQLRTMVDEVESDIDLYFEERRRKLYETSTTADECEKCIAAGKKHCWRKNLDYSGYYT